jgi:hypothetical protein
MLSILLDIEWLLSTLFDASLLTFEPPATAAPFFVLSRFGSAARAQVHRDGKLRQTLTGQNPIYISICLNITGAPPWNATKH